MPNPIRKTFIDFITEYLIDSGKNIAIISSPTAMLKTALEKIEKMKMTLSILYWLI